MTKKFKIEIIDQIVDTKNDNIDVALTLENDRKYILSFFTIENIKMLMNKSKKEMNGELAGGIFFWSSDMIIVEELTEEIITNTCEELVENYDLDNMFSTPIS